jgi:hypothetical protein
MISDVLVHHAVGGMAEHRSSLYAAQEAERGGPALSGFLPFPPFILSEHLAFGMVLPAFRVDLPPTPLVKPLWTCPHGHIKRCHLLMS